MRSGLWRPTRRKEIKLSTRFREDSTTSRRQIGERVYVYRLSEWSENF